jgi:hypothetical protein
MRAAFTAACAIVILAGGIILGAVITQRQAGQFLESECDRMDREEALEIRAEKRVAMNCPAPAGIRFHEAAEWDRLGLGERAR